MRGTFESGEITRINEVRVNQNGMYYGVYSAPGQGRHETTTFNDRREAGHALAALVKRVTTPSSGISAQQAADFTAALATTYDTPYESPTFSE